MVYFAIILYTLSLFYRYDIKGIKHGFIFHYYSLLFIVCCVVGFSYRLGTDTLAYMSFYGNYVSSDISYTITHLSECKFEPIWEILNSACKSIWDDFTLVQIVVAVFVNSVLFWFLRKHSPYLFAGLLFYFLLQFWNFNFEIKRESLAIAFFLIAIDNLFVDDVKVKNYIKYYFWCVPAMLCHHYAFAILIYPLFCLIRWSKENIALLFVLFLLLFFDFPFVTVIVNSFNYFSFFNAQDLISGHLSSDLYGQGNELSIFGLIHSVILPAIMLYIVRNKVDNRLFTFSVLYLFFFILQTKVFIFYRLCNYFSCFIIICYVCFLKHAYENRKNYPLYLCVLLLFITLQVRSKLSKQQYIRYYPYSSVFTKEINAEREAEYRRINTFQ